MSVNSEEKIYNDLMSDVPQSSESGGTAQSAAALAAVEQAAANVGDYSSTYSGKLDSAIQKYLSDSGFVYDPSQDKSYQQYLKDYEATARLAAQTSKDTATKLAGGYTPTYADAVASEIYTDRMGSADEAKQTFKTLAKQEYDAEQDKNANILSLYNTLESSDYSKYRDTADDYKNYLNLLASRYSTDRESDVSLDSANSDVYSTKLSGALSNLSDARNIDNSQYLYNTVSADQAAQNEEAERENAQKIAYDEYENNLKIAYSQAEDAYNERVAAEEAAQAQAEAEAEAQAEAEQEAAEAEQEAEDKRTEKEMKKKASKYIEDYNLKDANYNYKLSQIAVGYYNGQLSVDEANYIADELDVLIDDFADKVDEIEANGGSLVKRDYQR